MISYENLKLHVFTISKITKHAHDIILIVSQRVFLFKSQR